MKKTFPSLPQLEIASPCPKSWDKMTGDDQSRFCTHCDKSVFNLSEMTTGEVQQLLESDTSVCARLRRHEDGSIVTRDSKSSPRSISRRDWFSKFTSFAAMFLVMGAFAGCRRKVDEEIMGAVCPAEMGDIVGKVAAPANPNENDRESNGDQDRGIMGEISMPAETPHAE